MVRPHFGQVKRALWRGLDRVKRSVPKVRQLQFGILAFPRTLCVTSTFEAQFFSSAVCCEAVGPRLTQGLGVAKVARDGWPGE